MRKSNLLDLLSWALLFTFAFVAFKRMALNGDGGEYLMVTHALAKHQSVQILASDFSDFFARGEEALAKIGFPDAHFRELIERFHVPQPASWAGFASMQTDQIYSMHFWGYSLLAVPIYLVVTWLGLNPLLGMGLLNLMFVVASVLYLRKVFGVRAYFSLIVLGLSGTIFYLSWTGPEVMTAACLLMAGVAALRGDVGAGLFFAGLAAVQNPPAILLMPFILAARAWTCWKKDELWPGVGTARVGGLSIGLSITGLLLAALPYAFFVATFEVPSLTGKYFTLPELITVQRFVSLFFDLDQGVLPALPGLVTMWLVCLKYVPTTHRRRYLTFSLIAITCVIAMSIPILSAINWNSGSVVMTRYGYWLVMPFVGLLIIVGSQLSWRRQIPVLVSFVISQLIPIGLYGPLGHHWSTVSHTRLANFALYHFGEYYNPDPEIFYERGVGYEVNAPLASDLRYALLRNGQPIKVLSNVARPDANFGVCRDGERLIGSRRVSMVRGWFYEHPPFHCEKVPLFVHSRTWYAGNNAKLDNAPLIMGWSIVESTGRWTEGTKSTIQIPVPQGARLVRIRFVGHYFSNIANSDVSLNQGPTQVFDLRVTPVTAHVNELHRKDLLINLEHPSPVSPLELGMSQDVRKLAFFLERIELDVSE